MKMNLISINKLMIFCIDSRRFSGIDVVPCGNSIAENVCNGVFDCDNAYLYGYKLQGFMTGLCGMGYSLLRDIKKDLPCVIALEV